MSEADIWVVPLGLGEFTVAPKTLELDASTDVCAAIARRFNLVALKTLNAKLILTRWFDGGQIDGHWTAQVTQTCGVSLEDFDSSLKGKFQVRLVPESSPHAPDPDQEDVALDLEADDPPDVVTEQTVNLAQYVLEDLSLSIDPFPRRPGAVFVAPEPAAELSPFAVLRQLKPNNPQ